MNTSANRPGNNQQADKKPAAKRSSWLGYAFNPSLGSSIKPLTDNFKFFRMTIAMLFVTSGMLDKSHPFFRPDVRFTMGDLFRETYARFDWRDHSKMPQNIFFLAVWGLLALSALWVVTLVLYFLAGATPARAEETQPLFGIIPGSQDIATQFIDNLIKGDPITGMGTAGEAGYMPAGPVSGLIQSGLRGMLEFYSSAVLAFASFLLLYHVINMVVQAAWSGKALEGAAQIWAPLRLVLAICLLVPLGTGLNAAQLMTLEIAKLGSGLATRAWNVFGTALTNSNNIENIAMANLRGVEEPVKRLMIIYGCMADINIRLNATTNAVEGANNNGAATVGAIIGGLTGSIFGPVTAAAGAAAGGAAAMMLDDTIIEKVNWDHAANERLISVGAFRNPNLCGLTSIPAEIPETDTATSTGLTSVKAMRRTVQNEIATLSMDLRGKVKVGAACMAALYQVAGNAQRADAYQVLCNDAGVSTVAYGDNFDNTQQNIVRRDIMTFVGNAVREYYARLSDKIKAAAQDLSEQNAIRDNSSWIEAGVYFARVSAMQYAIVNAAQASLKASFGNVMGDSQIQVLRAGTRRAEAEASGGEQGGQPFLGMGQPQKDYFEQMLTKHADFVYGNTANGLAGFDYTLDDAGSIAQPSVSGTGQGAGAVAPGNVIIDGLFGSDNTAIIKIMTGPAALSDPINSLFNVGHMIYSSAIMLLFGGAALSIIAGFMGPIVGGIGGSIANAGIVLAYMMLTISFPVVFILPVLPLTRFLAGLMSWLLGLFEAIASMPLFALAHLNPKGNTLFEPAQRGYHYLLHIALKPILLVFGMIGVIIVLPIILYAHNALYGVVIDMMWDDKFVSPVDKIMFFLAYAGTAYGFVNIAFKAIDDLSSKSLGWGNFQNYGFRDDSEQVGQNTAAFAQYATTFAQQGGNALGGIQKAGQQAGKVLKERQAESAKVFADAEKSGQLGGKEDKKLLFGRPALKGDAGTGRVGPASWGILGSRREQGLSADTNKALKDAGASDGQIKKQNNIVRRGSGLANRQHIVDKLNDKEQLGIASARAAADEEREKKERQDLAANKSNFYKAALSPSEMPVTKENAGTMEAMIRSISRSEMRANGVTSAEISALRTRIDKAKK